MDIIKFDFTFEGLDADEHRIDFYDVNQALIGFQRSLALTTHLVLNNKIITQAPALKGARIYALPPEPGSWKTTAVIAAFAAGAYQLGTAPHDTPIGHLVFSMYDYVISESLGFHVDYDKSLGQLYEAERKKGAELPQLQQTRADSLIEKCSAAVKEMHRPIYMNQTAASASIAGTIKQRHLPLSTALSFETYQYLHETFVEPNEIDIIGRVSSYNANSFKGRIYVPDEGRPISFELVPSARSRPKLMLITSSLRTSAIERHSDNGFIRCRVVRQLSKTGHLKRYRVLDVSPLT